MWASQYKQYKPFTQIVVNVSKNDNNINTSKCKAESFSLAVLYFWTSLYRYIVDLTFKALIVYTDFFYFPLPGLERERA